MKPKSALGHTRDRIAHRDRREHEGREGRARLPRRARLRVRGFQVAALAVVLAACGSRTGLFADEDDLQSSTIDGGNGDGSVRRDASVRDVGRDVEDEPDALPPIDASVDRDASRVGCPDAAETLIYVITQNYELFSFSPTDGTFKGIGNIACPTFGGSATPFSMAVDRKGIAYILFADRSGSSGDDGRLFRVSTANAACIATSYVPNQLGFNLFGMGFATNSVGPTESLFVAASAESTGDGLGRIDIPGFTMNRVGPFRPQIVNAELTGTGDGRLFGFYTKSSAAGSFIGEIETTSGRVVAETPFPGVSLGQGWAFAAWGGDFYMFTAPNGSSEVTRYRPADGSVQVVATLPTVIVGAGVSTCAPSE